MSDQINCPSCEDGVAHGQMCGNCGGSGKIPRRVVLRITRHKADTPRWEYLRAKWGDISLLDRDVPYGDDPVATVTALLAEYRAEGREVIAIEVQAPFPVLMRLVGARRELAVPLIRAAFERGDDGRAIVVGKDQNGRDLFKFSHYEELVRIEFETRRL